MNPKLRMTLIAAAIASLIAGPTLAAGDKAEQSADMPQAEQNQPMDAAPSTEGDPGMASPDQSVTEHPLYSHTPQELQGSEVLDVAGESVGEVKKVVLGPDGQSAYAVVESGGLLGIATTEIIVAIDELESAEAGKLQANATKEELEARGEYAPEQYAELEPDKPISEFSAFEPEPRDDEPAAAEPGDGDPAAQTPETPRAPQ